MIPLAISASVVWGKVWPILLALVFFGVLIFFHELGHFLFAKLFKVKVNEFAMGMGPALIKKKKGDTVYALRLLPVGGFCSMEGEDTESENEGAFCNKPVWQRFIIVAAGGIVNIIIGIIVVAIMLCGSDLIGTTTVHSFVDGSESMAGMQPGDVICKINDKHVFSEYDYSCLVLRDSDGKIDLTVKRDGSKIELKDVEFGVPQLQNMVVRGIEPGILSVPKYSVRVTASISRMVYLSLFDLITGQYGLKDLSGPVGTVAYVSQTATQASEEKDFSTLYIMMALIAVNLGLFNLLPLPALDGGRLFFMLIEMIFRKPVPRKLEGWVHGIGLLLLLALMAVVTFSDILNLIRN